MVRPLALPALLSFGVSLGLGCSGTVNTESDAPVQDDPSGALGLDDEEDASDGTPDDEPGLGEEDTGEEDTGEQDTGEQDTGEPEPDDLGEEPWVAEPQSGTTVNVEPGVVEGVEDGNLRIFRGIPYAEPPIGNGRFAPPTAVGPWEGTRDASRFGAVCPQANLGELALGDVDISEDCLSVNVWAHDDGQQRPVMVFIYGGAFIMGATSQPIYDGAELARRGDVTVVSLNYRLGALGWLASAALAEDAGEPAAGNWGLYDQIEALRWVQSNIAAFGGDPDNVTVFGESAGAISVCALLGTPAADPLFHKAIIESGMCSLATYDDAGLIGMPSASVLAEQFVDDVGCADAFSKTDCLRALPWSDLIAATSLTDVITGDLEAISAMTPIVDGVLIPGQPIDRLRGGEVQKPIIVGSTEDEGLLFTSADVIVTRGGLQSHMEELMGEGPHIDVLMDLYPSSEFFFPKDAWTALLGEATFICPGLEVAKASMAPVYTYHFTHTPLAMAAVGAMHGLELPYVFGTFSSLGLIPSYTDLDLSDEIQAAWTSFARYGAPSISTGWSPFVTDAPSILLLDDDLESTDAIRAGRCEGLKALGIVY